MAVRALVRELIGSRTLVTLYAEEDPDVFIVTRIVALDADSLVIEFNGDEARRQALLQAPFLTVVGVPGPVKIQFRLSEVEVVQRAAASGGRGGDSAGESRAEGAGAILAAPIPSRGWRVQRRNAFRVQPPPSDHAVVAVRTKGAIEFKTPLTDLSVGGLAAPWPADVAQPELGSTLLHCRIEAHGGVPIPCNLRVVRIDRAADNGEVQMSCEFDAMPQTVARLVQLYVMDIEKRARLLRPSARTYPKR